MAINPELQYPGKITPSTVDYPYGQARNITNPGDSTGTPWEAALVNDVFGFQQALLSAAGIVPTGTPDKVGASQYLESLITLFLPRYLNLTSALNSTALKLGQSIFVEERAAGQGGGGVWDVVLESSVTVDGYRYVQCISDPTLAIVANVNDGINVNQLGAVTGTDSTGALKAAFAELGSTSLLLYFERNDDVYLFDPSAAFGINLNTVTNFIIDGNYATIKCIDAAPAAANGVILWFEDCEDGVINNLFTDGNLPNRTGSEPAGAHNIKLRNANKRLKFNNCKFLRSVTDGFYIDATSALTPSVDVELNNCEGAYCYRGNVSAIDSERLKIKGGSYHSASGVNPQHGIDFEDNGTYGNKNFSVEDVDVYGNDGEGMQISGALGVKSSKIKNIRLWDNGKSASAFGSDMKIGLFDGLVMEDIYFKGNTNNVSRALCDFSGATSNDLVLKNINFIDANPSGGSKSCMYLHSNITGEVDIEGVTISGTNSIGLFCDVDDATISGLTVRNSTAGNTISGGGDRIRFSEIEMFNNADAPIISGNDCVVDGFLSVDCANTNFNLWMNGLNPTVRNITIQQTVSIPGTQKGIAFTSEPREISTVRAVSAGTDFSGANIFNLIGDVFDDTTMSNIAPGHWTKEQISADNGDADKTLVRGVDEKVQRFSTPLTAIRTVTLPSANIRNGDWFRIIREASATGAFNLAISGINLTPGDYVIVQYDGTQWISVEKGTL